jgi:hypothetical protein
VLPVEQIRAARLRRGMMTNRLAVKLSDAQR